MRIGWWGGLAGLVAWMTVAGCHKSDESDSHTAGGSGGDDAAATGGAGGTGGAVATGGVAPGGGSDPGPGGTGAGDGGGAGGTGELGGSGNAAGAGNGGRSDAGGMGPGSGASGGGAGEPGAAGASNRGTGGDAGDGGASTGTGGSGGLITDPPIDGCSNVTSGWTEWAVGSGTTLYYVSSSLGSDDNDGLSESTPFATLGGAAEAIRAAAGADRGEAAVVDAHLLVRRGDTFDTGFGNFTIHGVSAERPFVVRPYGDESDPRPILTDELFRTQGGGGVPTEMTTAHVAFVGLHVYASQRDPDSPDFVGTAGQAAFSMLRPFDNLWLEDMLFESWPNLVVQPSPSGTNFTMRRCIVIDNYQDLNDGHSQGIYASNVNGLRFEENVFDHNGWNLDAVGGDATMFNHNFYIQGDCSDPVLRENIIARGSSHGFQLRPHGLAENNLLIANAIAGFVAGDNPIAGMQQALRRNVMVHAGQHQFDDGSDRGWGLDMFGIDTDLAVSPELTDNIAAHSGPVARFAFQYEDAVVASGNITYDWNGESDPGPFVDPERDIPSYHASLGGVATIEAFLAGARAQRRGHWCAEYTAAVVNDWIREGFAAP